MAKINLHKATREQLVDGAGLRPLVAEAILKVRDERGGEIADISALKDAVSEVKGIGPASLDQLGNVLKVSRQATKPAAETPAEAAAPAVKAGTEDAQPADRSGSLGREGRGRGGPPDDGRGCRHRNLGREGRPSDSRGDRQGPRLGRESRGRGGQPHRGEDRRDHLAGGSRQRRGGRRVAEKTAEVTSLAARGGVEMVGRTVSGLADAEKAAVARSSEAASELSQFVARLVNEQVQANIEMLQTLARARTWREALEAQTEFFRGNIERMTSGTSRYVETVARLTTGLGAVGRGKEKRAA